MKTLYLAYGSTCDTTLAAHAEDGPVDLLVAYPTWRDFDKRRSRYNIGRLMLDSGAFGVAKSGKRVCNVEYTAFCVEHASLFDEIVGLDVIGDVDAGKRNLDHAWSKGVAAIPVWHQRDPIEYLKWCASHADKIGLSAKYAGRFRAVRDAARIVWPKRLHGFGLASWAAIRSTPFESVDASSWIFAPRSMGMWAGYTGRQMPVRARGDFDVWVEVLEHRRRQRWAAARWAEQMKELDDADNGDS